MKNETDVASGVLNPGDPIAQLKKNAENILAQIEKEERIKYFLPQIKANAQYRIKSLTERSDDLKARFNQMSKVEQKQATRTILN
jgi:hypothetical protein